MKAEVHPVPTFLSSPVPRAIITTHRAHAHALTRGANTPSRACDFGFALGHKGYDDLAVLKEIASDEAEWQRMAQRVGLKPGHAVELRKAALRGRALLAQ